MPQRARNELRPIAITPHYVSHPEGSALIAWGDTRVLCTASIEDRVPAWLVGKGRGWVTAEYDMLPRATNTRRDRDARRGRVNARTQEISRLIGRSLRAAVALDRLGERTVTVDCDVLQADGGTRTAAITGGFVALALAVKLIGNKHNAAKRALVDHVVAVSAGVFEEGVQLDLDYLLDSQARVDLNVVMTGSGELVEVQGTGEKASFSRKELQGMLDVAFDVQPMLVDLQKRAIAVELQEDLETVRL